MIGRDAGGYFKSPARFRRGPVKVRAAEIDSFFRNYVAIFPLDAPGDGVAAFICHVSFVKIVLDDLPDFGGLRRLLDGYPGQIELGYKFQEALVTFTKCSW